jgi:glycine/D-amino acid oxidase-like deaminating enzyme
LSFRLHNDLAKEHNGAEIWGHRNVFASEIKLLGQDVQAGSVASSVEYPDDLDWLLDGSIQQYDEIGVPSNSGQVNPYMFTKTLGQLAESMGVLIYVGTKVTKINTNEETNVVHSIDFIKDGKPDTLEVTDVLVAAGPWTPSLLPTVSLLTPRGHSVILTPTRSLSPYILFPDIQPAKHSSFDKLISPDIYPRPSDNLHEFDTVYASGPDDYETELPSGTDQVQLVEKKCADVLMAMGSVSREIHDGEIVAKQACYKPQICKHGEAEEVGPIVGPVGIQGLWLATGHDEWGIQNAPGTGLVMSEMILEGRSRSADCTSLDPKHFLNSSPSMGT